jgi:hypothetical protein
MRETGKGPRAIQNAIGQGDINLGGKAKKFLDRQVQNLGPTPSRTRPGREEKRDNRNVATPSRTRPRREEKGDNRNVETPSPTKPKKVRGKNNKNAAKTRAGLKKRSSSRSRKVFLRPKAG